MRPSVLLMLTGLVGCEVEELCDRAAAVDDAGLELGLGEKEFVEPLADGVTLQQSYGQQGGSHLYLAVRTRGFDPGERRTLGADRDVPLVVVELVAPDTGDVLTTQRFKFEAFHGDEVEAELALGEFVLPSSYGSYSSYSSTYGSTPTGGVEPSDEYLLRATAEDACGTVFVDEHLVTIE